MNFLCRCCKQRIVKKERPVFIGSAGLHETAYHMEWIRFTEDNTELSAVERKWEFINDTPKVGETHVLRIERPFDEEIGGQFTNIFEPWQMSADGWEYADSPEDIYKAAAVLCRFVDVIWADDYSGYIHVEIVNVVLLSDLYKVIPETISESPVEMFGENEDVWTEYEDNHWLYRNWTGQGDVGDQQWLYTDENGVTHEVMANWWDFDDNTYYLLNRINKSGTYTFSDRKKFIFHVSPQFRMGWGYVDAVSKHRKYFAFCGQPDGSLSVVMIRDSDTFRLYKDYPTDASYNYKQAEEFRTKYIDGRKPCENEEAAIAEWVEEYLENLD